MTRDLWRTLRHASPDVRALNADLLKTPPEAGKMAAPDLSNPEAEFLNMWVALEYRPTPIREYRFHKTRRWRFDFAWPVAMIAVEIEGGQWMRGRHNRPEGYADDCEKYNAATLAGWRVFRFTPAMVTLGNCLMVWRAIRDYLEPETR